MNYDDLFMQTKSILHSVSGDFARLEHMIVGLQSLDRLGEVNKLIETISASLQSVSSNCDRLTNLLPSLEPISHRSQMRLSLDQMRFECKHNQASLQATLRKKNEKERQLRERAELLSQNFTTNASYRNPNSNHTVVKLDADIDHHCRLTAVGRRLDEMLASGSASLASLADQGRTLKSVQKRVFDMLNTLGLSNTVMRLIERRSRQDKILFWVLAFSSTIVMWSIWKYFH